MLNLWSPLAGGPLDTVLGLRTQERKSMSSNLWLTVEVALGAGIEQTCDDAVLLAARTGLSIWFDFNGVKCLAREGDDPRRIEEAWGIALKRPPGHGRIARDNGDRPNADVEAQHEETPNAKLTGVPPTDATKGE